MYAGKLSRDTMGDMMPDDIPHTDDKAKRKSHPGAKASLFLSLVSVAPFVCGVVLIFSGDYTELSFDFVGYGTVIVTLCCISLCVAQPLGILLGIDSLVQIRKDSSYCYIKNTSSLSL